MIAECARHGLPWKPDTELPAWSHWYVKRCSHFGHRFVVDIRVSRGGFAAHVDYVEDRPAAVVSEGVASPSPLTIVCTTNNHTEDEANQRFDMLVARMLADDPPYPAEHEAFA
jgi:hypothetical protein